MIERFWSAVYNCKRAWNSFVSWLDNFAAWQAFFFLFLSTIAYQILIEFESLNYAFFIFQILLLVEAVTYLTQGCILAYYKIKGSPIYFLIALSITLVALSPFLVYYPHLRLDKWPLWIFLYFAVGYPLTYLFLSFFSYKNKDVYYKSIIGVILSVLMLVCGAVSLLYAFIYGAYMHYLEIPFISREIVTNIVYFVQATDMSGVERLFQFMLLLNAACISNYNFGYKNGKYL